MSTYASPHSNIQSSSDNCDLHHVLEDLIDNPQPPRIRIFPCLSVPPAPPPGPHPVPNEKFRMTVGSARGEFPGYSLYLPSSLWNPTVFLSTGGATVWQGYFKDWRSAFTLVHPDATVVRALNASPLGSRAACRRAHVKGPEALQAAVNLKKSHVPRPNFEFISRPLHDTKLPGRRFSSIIVEQPHLIDMKMVIPEIERLAAPGALISLVGYSPLSIDGDLGPLIDWEGGSTLRRLRYRPEHLLDGRFHEIHFPFAEPLWVKEKQTEWGSSAKMEARWDLHELIAHLRSWQPLRNWEHLDAFAARQFLKDLELRWGAHRRRHCLTWDVVTRFGTVTG